MIAGMRTVRSRHFASLLSTVVAFAACGVNNAASKLVSTPEFAPKDQTKCGVKKSQSRPLIVEWPSADRMELESKVRQGVVAVRYVGCEMDVLERCSAPAKYKYLGATRSRDSVVVNDEDDLYANLPVGAAKLEGKLRRSGKLTVTMDLVGRYEAERPTLRADELQGECGGATHFIYGVTVGAFDFYAGGEAEVGGSAGVGGAGAGAHSQAQCESITKNGDGAACAKASPDDKEPPPQCGALIRIEVVPIGNGGGGATAAAPSSVPAGDTGMVSLPAAKFVMGGQLPTGGGYEPPIEASVAAFAIDRTEVTVKAYAACVEHGRCSAPATTGDFCNFGKSDRADHPINCVAPYQAELFCASLGKRLPTSEEWEYAARGTDGRVFPWGDAPVSNQPCFRRLDEATKKGDGTCAVGASTGDKTPTGILDLVGNVSELTQKRDAGEQQVIHVRGASWAVSKPGPWMSPIWRSTISYWSTAKGDAFTGFRCAKSL